MLTLVDRLIIIDRGRIIADGPRDNVLAALKKGQIHATQ
jgi:ATP-binding cassette subfamily C protein LapB